MKPNWKIIGVLAVLGLAVLYARRASAATGEPDAGTGGGWFSGVSSGASPLSAMLSSIPTTAAPAPAPTQSVSSSTVGTTSTAAAPAPAPAPAPLQPWQLGLNAFTDPMAGGGGP